MENISFPRTKRSTKAYRDPRKTKSFNNSTTLKRPPKKLSNSKCKPKRLSRLEVNEFMVEKNIHRATELYAAAEERRRSDRFGSPCPAMYQKTLNDLIEST